MWEIVSFGNVGIINLVFNAISSFFQDGSFKAAAVAVCLFSVVGHSIKSLGEGAKELPFPQLLASIIIFGFGFQTLTNVSVENRYDGTITQIDNIPVAIAVPQSLITSIGYSMARSVETAFGNTGMERITENGYLAPLKVIANLRRATYASECQSSEAMAGEGIDLCRSLSVYIKDCSSVTAERDHQYTEQKEQDLLTSLGFNSASWGTTYYNESGEPLEASCADAYNKIVDGFNGSPWEEMINVYNVEVGARMGEDTQDRVTDALEAIKADASKSRNLIQTMFLSRPQEIGTARYLIDSGAADLAENYNSSITQRNYGWAIQGEIWIQIVEVFLSLMEALVLGAAPLIALMTLTGATGVKSLMLYLQVVAVLQLIPVFMIIAQNIIMENVVIFQAGLVARGWDEGSKAYMLELTRYANEMMGLGGMISATIVPALAMALVTGSGMALMGAMKGAAPPAKDTDAAPDIADQSDSITNMGNSLQGDYFKGGQSITERDQAQLAQIQTTRQASESVKAAKMDQSMASTNYSTQQSEGIKTVQDEKMSASELSSMGQKITSGESEQAKLTNDVATQAQRDHSLSRDESSQLKAMLGLGGNFGFGKVGEEIANNSNVSKSVKDAYSSITKGAKGEELASKFENARSQDYQNKSEFTSGNSKIDEQSSSVSKAYQEQKSATENYEAATQLQSIHSMSQADQMTNYRQLANDKQVMSNLEKYVSGMPPEQQRQYRQRVDDLTNNNADSDVSSGLAELMAFSEVTRQNGDNLALADVVGGGYEAPINETGVGDLNKNEGDSANIKGVGGPVANTVDKAKATDPSSLREDFNKNKEKNESNPNNPYEKAKRTAEEQEGKIESTDILQRDGAVVDKLVLDTAEQFAHFSGGVAAINALEDIGNEVGSIAYDTVQSAAEATTEAKDVAVSFYENVMGIEPESPPSLSERLSDVSETFTNSGAEMTPEQKGTYVANADEVDGRVDTMKEDRNNDVPLGSFGEKEFYTEAIRATDANEPIFSAHGIPQETGNIKG